MSDQFFAPLDSNNKLSNPSNAELVSRTLDSAYPNTLWETTTKGIPLAIVSAGTQLWNGVGTLGNISIPFGADVKPTDIIGAESYKDYYAKHHEGVDFAGFLGSAWIPSTLAIKGVKALQTIGRVSEASAGSLGLLTNQAEGFYLSKAADAMALGANPRLYRTAAALSSGLQVGLEATAAEAATYAALNQSPMYDGVHDVGDFLGNLATVGGTFGALGTAFKYMRQPATKFSYAGWDADKTTLGEVRSAVAKARQEASYIEAPIGGNGEYLDIANTKLFVKQNKPVMISDTAGNVVEAAYNFEPPKNAKSLNPFKEGSEAYNNFNVRLEADIAQRANTANTLKYSAINNLVKDSSADIRPVIKNFLDDADPQTRSYILANLESVSRATVEGGVDPKVMYLDLATGEVAQKAHVLAPDIGKVTYKEGVVRYGDKAISFPDTNLASLSTRTVDEHNVAYHFVEQAMEKAKTVDPNLVIMNTDLPTMEAYFKKFGEFTVQEGQVKPTKYTGQDALDKLVSSKREAFDTLIKNDPTMSFAELKARLNVSDDFLLNNSTAEGSLYRATDFNLPSKVQVVYGEGGKLADTWKLKAEIFHDTRKRALQETNTDIAETLLGLQGKLPDIKVSELTGIDTLNGKFLYANPNFNTMEEKITYVGGHFQSVKEDFKTNRVKHLFNVDARLQRTGIGSEAMAELNSIVYMVRSSKDSIYLENGNLVKKVMVNGKPDTEILATVVNKDALDYLSTYKALDKELADKKVVAIRASGGRGFDTDALYFPPPHPDDVAYRAFVTDAHNNVGMIFADSKKALAEKIDIAKRNFPNQLNYYSEDSAAIYKQLLGEYDRTLDTRGFNKINSALESKGVMADIFASTNPVDFTNMIHRGLSRTESDIVHKAVNLRYGQAIMDAKAIGETLGMPESVYSKIYRTLTSTPDNSTTWATFQGQVTKGIDNLVNMGWNAAGDVLNRKMTISQAEAQQIAERFNVNKGINIFDSEELWNMSGRRTFTGGAATAIHEVNSLMRTAQLGLDYVNGFIQAAGFPILALPAIRSAINEGDYKHVKIMHQAIKDIFGANKKSIMDNMVNMSGGVVSEDMYKYHDLLESHAQLVASANSSAALKNAAGVKAKLAKFLDTMQTPTAFAEKYTAAWAYRCGELAYEVGKTSIDPIEQAAFASNMARKIVGNFATGQKPQIFQGILGSALGLFQTYQSTYFQQAARFLEHDEGTKLYAMMLALQGTVFGASSLPTFDVLNKAVVSNWNDRKQGADTALTNTAALPVLGEIGDSIMYGALSSSLGSALYTRGDVTPRAPMGGMPWNLENLAQVQYVKNILKAMGQWYDSVSNGGSLTMSSAEAIAHANLNRPLTGIMETITGVHTTKGGTLETAIGNDLFSLSTAMRIAGTRPLHEVIATSESYKFGMVKAEEQKKLASVAYALRSRIMSEPNSALDEAVITEYAKRYSDAGGNPQGFNKWFAAAVGKATTPRAQDFAKKIANDKFAISYQELARPEGMNMLPAPSKQEVLEKLAELDSKAKAPTRKKPSKVELTVIDDGTQP